MFLMFRLQDSVASLWRHFVVYEILWKLYLESYSSYCVRTKVLTKFGCDLDLFTPTCIGIFLSPSCIYVRNMNAVRWKLVKLSCQNQRDDNVQLWPWPLTPKYIGIFLLSPCIYVWNIKAVRWKLLKLSCQNQSVDGQTDGRTNLISVGRPPSGGALTIYGSWIWQFTYKCLVLRVLCWILLLWQA